MGFEVGPRLEPVVADKPADSNVAGGGGAAASPARPADRYVGTERGRGQRVQVAQVAPPAPSVLSDVGGALLYGTANTGGQPASLTRRVVSAGVGFLPWVSTPAAWAEYSEQFDRSRAQGGVGNWAMTGLMAAGVLASLVPGASLVRGGVRVGVREAAPLARDGVQLMTAESRATTVAGQDTRVVVTAANETAVVAQRNLASALQRAADAGPNVWIPTGNAGFPHGPLLQRGVTGDYAGAANGVAEAQAMIRGSDTERRTFSFVGDASRVEEVTAETTRQYANPLAFQARVEPAAIGAGRADPERFLNRALSPADVTSVNLLTAHRADDAYSWYSSYRRLLTEQGATPAAGSRGARFIEEVDATIARVARWQQNEFGHYLTNSDELGAALRAVFQRYGGSH